MKVIVFDIDRTLVDSYKSDLVSFQEALETVLGKSLTEEECKNMTALPTTVFIKSLNLTDDQIMMIKKEWARTYEKYKTLCFPNIKDIVKKLYDEGYLLGIITSRTQEEFHELDYELNDIISYFKVVVTSDLISNPKPNTDSMDYLCDKLKCLPQDIIYIGDSSIDKAFAHNSNVAFIPACWENKELENESNACFDVLKLIDMIKEY